MENENQHIFFLLVNSKQFKIQEWFNITHTQARARAHLNDLGLVAFAYAPSCQKINSWR